MLKTLTAIALTAGVLAGASNAHAMGAGYPWLGKGETYPGTVARHTNQEIVAVHPNAMYQYQTGRDTGAVVKQTRHSPLFAGHPNVYFQDEASRAVASDVTVVAK